MVDTQRHPMVHQGTPSQPHPMLHQGTPSMTQRGISGAPQFQPAAAAAAPMPTLPQVVREVVVVQPVTTFFGEEPVSTICVHCQQRVTTVVTHVPGMQAFLWFIVLLFM